jgi:hypothetical protein
MKLHHEDTWRYVVLVLAVVSFLVMATCAYAATAYTAHIAWTPPTKNTDGSNITGAISYRVTSGASSQVTTATSYDWSSATAGQCFTVSAIVAGLESDQSNPACLGQKPNAPTTITVTVTTTVTVP